MQRNKKNGNLLEAKQEYYKEQKTKRLFVKQEYTKE